MNPTDKQVLYLWKPVVWHLHTNLYNSLGFNNEKVYQDYAIVSENYANIAFKLLLNIAAENLLAICLIFTSPKTFILTQLNFTSTLVFRSAAGMEIDLSDILSV